jgi:hypothetical protein
MSLQFASVKILDYAPQLENLLTNFNPFALVTAAHLLTQRTRKDVQARYKAKWRLAKLLYERNWGKQQIIDLFSVIDWLMTLPPELEKKLWTSISELERNIKMPYVTSVERIGIEQGIERGIERGEMILLRRMLTKRFGELPSAIEIRLSQALIADLELWGDRFLDAQTLTDIFD